MSHRMNQHHTYYYYTRHPAAGGCVPACGACGVG